MKHFLFVYREDREAYVDNSFGYSNRVILKDVRLPKQVTDEEVIQAAREDEVQGLYLDHQTASEGCLSRQLLRVVQVARDLDLVKWPAVETVS